METSSGAAADCIPQGGGSVDASVQASSSAPPHPPAFFPESPAPFLSYPSDEDPASLHAPRRLPLTTRYPSKRSRSSPLESCLSSPPPSSSLDCSSDPSVAPACDFPQSGLPDPYDFHAARPGTGESISFQKNCSTRGASDIGSTFAESLPASASNNTNMIRGRGTGSIFFKTKLCCKFRTGTCPYNSSCNFAHGMEELRKPPPGWEEMVAAHEAEKAMRSGGQSQVLVESTPAASVENQRFQKTPRSCRKFYTEEGCPYGDRCIFMHDDQSFQVRALRESNAISLGPMTTQANVSIATGGSSGDRSSSWKTRVCNKWETTGHCPFGQKCHFSHGATEPYNSVPYSKNGVAGARALGQAQSQVQKMMQLKWKGPEDGISTIYGDWIEEDEWEATPVNVVAG